MRFDIISTFAVLACSAQGLGINCRGSGLCPSAAGSLTGVRDALQDLIDAGHSERHYAQGQQIACSGSVCAFFQKLPGGQKVQVAYDKVNDLLSHGCKKCGSCPTKPGNNVDTGELTVNYVSKTCCSGDSCYCL